MSIFNRRDTSRKAIAINEKVSHSTCGSVGCGKFTSKGIVAHVDNGERIRRIKDGIWKVSCKAIVGNVKEFQATEPSKDIGKVSAKRVVCQQEKGCIIKCQEERYRVVRQWIWAFVHKRILYAMRNLPRLVADPMVSGKGPEKVLLLRRKSVRAERLPIASSISPSILLLSRRRTLTSVIPKNPAGIGPDSSLNWARNSLRFTRLPISSGSGPLIWLSGMNKISE